MKSELKKYATAAILTLIMFAACKKDPYDGVVSHERSIEAVTLGNGLIQVGPAVVDREQGTVLVKVLMEANTDLTKVGTVVQTSYRSRVSPASGEIIDFASNNNEYEYVVTSESGQERKWIVKLEPFTETILGTYDIENLVVYGGTGPEYGGAAVMDLASKPWVWPADNSPDAELDNTLTFSYTGVTEAGNTYGKVVNDAGPDGKYADFMFVANPQTDVNNFYRKIPKGESTWERDYTTNTVTFKTADGKTTSGVFADARTIDLGNGQTKVITGNSFDFTLSGTDDWNAIYSDYDKFVKRPRRFWVDIKKQN